MISFDAVETSPLTLPNTIMQHLVFQGTFHQLSGYADLSISAFTLCVFVWQDKTLTSYKPTAHMLQLDFICLVFKNFKSIFIQSLFLIHMTSRRP